MSINWRERFLAAFIHFLATLLVAGVAAALIFLVWYPGQLAVMVGGGKLFFIVVACDLILGPLISLVIYNSLKSRRELFVDYGIVAVLQLAALIYGVSVVAVSRPVFVAFFGDRLEIVTAIELDDADLAAGTAPQFQTKSWSGPRLVSVHWPTDLKAQQELLETGLAGKDGQLFPKYYREYDAAGTEIQAKSQTVDVLLVNSGAARSSVEAAIAATGKQAAELRWLHLHHRFGFGIALIDAHHGRPLGYAEINPTWVVADAAKP